MRKRKKTATATGNQPRAPWAGLTFVVGLAALFIALYPQRIPPVMPPPASTPLPTTPPISSPTPLPDFAIISSVHEKKRAFFAFMGPLIEAENATVLSYRRHLLQLHAATGAFSPEKRIWMRDLAHRYKLTPFSPDSPTDRMALLSRVDIIPLSLAMAQAANESAWGTSRFAREGNNIFGQWVFGKGKGMVPKQRTEGASHEVARFKSVSDSISSYIHNLNTLWAYEPLRSLRREQRAKGEEPAGEPLAMGLERYSSRGKAYVLEIQRIIRINTSLLSER